MLLLESKLCKTSSVCFGLARSVTPLLFLLLCVIGLTRMDASEYECRIEWQKGYGIPSAVNVADINSDDLSEVLVASMEGFAHVAGSQEGGYLSQWTSANIGRHAVLGAGDTDGDGIQEIVVGGEAGYVYVFGFNGLDLELEWQSQELDSSVVGIDVGDVDDDDQAEMVIRTSSQLYVFGPGGDSYLLEWYQTGFSSYHSCRCLGIADTDGDGTQEIVTISSAPDDSYIYVIGYDGATYVQEWADTLSCIAMGVGETDGDTISEIILGMNCISVYKYDGGTYGEVWTDSTIQPLIPVDFRVSDVDGDNVGEIVAMLTIDYDGYIRVYGYDGDTYREEWQSSNLSSFGGSSLGVGDADNDDTEEIIAGNWEGMIFVFGYTGSEYELEWMNEELGRSAFGLDLGNVAPGEQIEVIWGDIWGRAYVYGETPHHELWRSEDLESQVHAIASGDVDDDSELEFAAGDHGGCIHLFGHDGNTYVQEWENDVGTDISGLAIGDVDGDERREMAVACNTFAAGWQGSVLLYAFDGGDYLLEWQNDLAGRIEGMCIGDADNDHLDEFITSDSERLYIFGFNGAGYELEDLIEDFIGGWPQPYGVAVGDVNDDGEAELIVGTKYGFVSVFHFDGEDYAREWRSDDLGSDAFGIGIGDVDESGNAEIVVGVGTPYTEGLMYLFEHEDGSYEQRWSSSDLGYQVGRYNSIGIGPIDSDEQTGVAVATRGYVYVLDFESASVSPSFIRADANGDSAVTMEDATYTLRYLYIPSSPTPMCMKAADSDDGADVAMSDAIYTLRFLYVPDSPEPPPPFPECGVDPTEDTLGCGWHPCVE